VGERIGEGKRRLGEKKERGKGKEILRNRV
jgi:hypothetical protein